MTHLLRVGLIAVVAMAVGSTFAQGAKKGQAAPEIKVSEARGVPATWKLADAKGKWVIVEFWGHW
ncbi:MAG: hypothetical protein JNG88_16100 [Phycisphaerales bacterium]|nr:hypothetical protein [Phycisphaerales bacterium]